MVYTEKTETWCECDNCHFTMFAGFNATKADVVSSFKRDGWTFGRKVLCDSCSADTGWVKREIEKSMIKAKGA